MFRFAANLITSSCDLVQLITYKYLWNERKGAAEVENATL